jgi:hypothetical protein
MLRIAPLPQSHTLAPVCSLKVASESSARANAVLRERLALYSGGVGLEGTGVGGVADALTGSVPPEDLERALTMVRRRIDNPSRVGDAELGLSTAGGGATASATGGADDAAATSVPALRNKVQQLQLALLTAQREAERADRMLRAQTAIAQDLSAEVADLNERLGAEGAGVKRRLADTEALAEARLQRVHMLEAQVKQLLAKLRARGASSGGGAATGKQQRGGLPTIQDDDDEGAGARRGRGRRGGQRDRDGLEDSLGSADDGDRSTVISALSADDSAAGGRGRHGGGGGAHGAPAHDNDTSSLASELLDFGPGEDVLEVYVVDAMLDPDVLGRHDTTFAMVDFYDFETQASPLATGAAPEYRFSATYRVATDAYFLRHMAGESLTVDVNQARGADYALVARATVPLGRLLTSESGKLTLPAVPLRARDGRAVGTLHLQLRAAVPLAELWAQFQRDRPAEGAALAASMKARLRDAGDGGVEAFGAGGGNVGARAGAAPSAAATSSGGAPHNELTVTVVGASGLAGRNSARRPPSAYVQYTLPGMATAFTPIVPANAAPAFSDARSFPVAPTARYLAQLADRPLKLLVVDDAAADDGSVARASATAAPNPASRSGSGGGALIGTATVSLAGVAEGLPLEGTFDVRDERGAPAGRLTVR